ncbi:hypothetical protein IU501_10970 [Nocardia otitidiscaviarum]|uniref:hypothetical protein n=1 Tax=Nocardia otitidiscaviarum TaxID=1823 RepID=UPI0018943AE4|nr:hypothetical protein [Nocardia otitidiscaviarum]MBF6133521.1 hypothetical protein [Nocardia otitidiscaviarum]
MTTPNLPGEDPPAGSLGVGLFRTLQDKSVEDAKSVMSGGILGAFEHTQDTLHDEYNQPISEKPGVQEIPMNSVLWQTMDPREHSTFPRAQLMGGAAAGTASGGSGDNSHSHSLNRVPDYQPSGNGSDYLEIGFIRIPKDCTLYQAGFITGDSQTFLDVAGAYLGVFRMDPVTGDLTLLNTDSATLNIKSSITNTNTEHRFTLGLDIEALQDEIYAVGVLQDTTLIQTAASIMCTRMTDLYRSETAYPRKNYAYAGTYASIPATIAESSLRYDSSTKLPFFYLREKLIA